MPIAYGNVIAALKTTREDVKRSLALVTCVNYKVPCRG